MGVCGHVGVGARWMSGQMSIGVVGGRRRMFGFERRFVRGMYELS
jgi:hypothetical protein